MDLICHCAEISGGRIIIGYLEIILSQHLRHSRHIRAVQPVVVHLVLGRIDDAAAVQCIFGKIADSHLRHIGVRWVRPAKLNINGTLRQSQSALHLGKSALRYHRFPESARKFKVIINGLRNSFGAAQSTPPNVNRIGKAGQKDIIPALRIFPILSVHLRQFITVLLGRRYLPVYLIMNLIDSIIVNHLVRQSVYTQPILSAVICHSHLRHGCKAHLTHGIFGQFYRRRSRTLYGISVRIQLCQGKGQFYGRAEACGGRPDKRLIIIVCPINRLLNGSRIIFHRNNCAPIDRLPVSP